LKIENCAGNDFEFICPKKWSELKSTYVEGIRHCHVCKKNVYWCHSADEVKLHVSVNHCIALRAETYEEIQVINEAADLQKQATLAVTQEKLNAPDTRVPFVGVWRRKSNSN
jgi:hypothetical protein